MHRAHLAFMKASPPKHSSPSRSPRAHLAAQASGLAAREPLAPDVASLLRENQMLEERNRVLTERIEDHEGIVKRLWRRGWAEAPSPRGIKEVTTHAAAVAAQERQEADEARAFAQRILRDSMQAKAEAEANLIEAQSANATLEAERSRMREWHASDASDLSRRMGELSRQLGAEHVKRNLLEADAEHQAVERTREVGHLLAQLEGVRAAAAEQARRHRAEAAELTARWEASWHEAEELRLDSLEARQRAVEEAARQAAALERAREAAAHDAVVHEAQQRTLSDELALTHAENARLRAELDESRHHYDALCRRAHEEQVRAATEHQRMNVLIEKLDASGAVHGSAHGASNGALHAPAAPTLPTPSMAAAATPAPAASVAGGGGDPDLLGVAIRAAETRKLTIERLERLSFEREQTIEDLRANLALSERLRADENREQQATIDKLRWLQAKAISPDGSAKPGRFRSMMYWENMKSCHARSPRSEREVMLSWRGDDDQTRMSQLVDVEHLMARAAGDATMTAEAMAVH